MVDISQRRTKPLGQLPPQQPAFLQKPSQQQQQVPQFQPVLPPTLSQPQQLVVSPQATLPLHPVSASSEPKKEDDSFNFATIIAIVASALVIAQFFGFINISAIDGSFFLRQALLHIPGTESITSYSTKSPICDAAKDPKGVVWYSYNKEILCLTNDNGIQLTQKIPNHLTQIYFTTYPSKLPFNPLAFNQAISVNFSGLRSDMCAGITTRGNILDEKSYAFYVCGDGDWYILQYASNGVPIILGQDTVAHQNPPLTDYNLVVTVDNNNLQMVINRAQIHTVQLVNYSLYDYISTNIDSIALQSKVALLTPPSNNMAIDNFLDVYLSYPSVKISEFNYQSI